jgi:hypothetical protein
MDSYKPFSVEYCNKNKIDKNNNYNLDDKYTSNTMKPKYSTNESLMCGVIEYNNKTYLLDLHDKDRIINFNKNFVFVNETDIYPSYSSNYKRLTYLDFIFNYNNETVCYKFKNGNEYDLRRNNILMCHFYHKNISEKYNIINYIPGHHKTIGHDANIMKNPLWEIIENEKKYLLMYCEKNTVCKLCPESYQKILDFEQQYNNGKKLTWYKHLNGYILTHTTHLDTEHPQKYYFIHQVITGCYGNGKGTKNISVDHIDQNPLNNSMENLRIATRKEQEQNTTGIKEGTKRERNYNAKALPDGITQEMLKKYVYYTREFYDKDKKKEREFFRVEHPNLDKPWSTTKSNKISIQDKLLQANKVIEDLENGIYPEKNDPILPKYVSLVIMREKPHLVFEKRTDEKRLNIKMVLPKEYDLQEQLQILNEKIKVKYDGLDILL